MTKEEIKELVDEEIEKKLQQYGLIKKEEKQEQYYNPMYMRDNWYGD